MTFIKANRDAILKPLLTVTGIVERRHTMPILANVLISKVGEQISFLASDAEIQIRTSAELSSGSDSIATTVSAFKIRDILKALPEGSDVTIRLDERKASIQAGRSRFSLQTLADTDFPTLAAVETWPVSLTLSQKQLKSLLQSVSYAMAVQDVRYYLNGVLFATEGATLRTVATDGHRLALCDNRIEGAHMPSQEVILPRKTVLELQRLLSDSDEPVLIDLAERQIRLRFDQIEYLSALGSPNADCIAASLTAGAVVFIMPRPKAPAKAVPATLLPTPNTTVLQIDDYIYYFPFEYGLSYFYPNFLQHQL